MKNWKVSTKDTKFLLRPFAIKKGYRVVTHRTRKYQGMESLLGLKTPTGRVYTRYSGRKNKIFLG